MRQVLEPFVSQLRLVLGLIRRNIRSRHRIVLVSSPTVFLIPMYRIAGLAAPSKRHGSRAKGSSGNVRGPVGNGPATGPRSFSESRPGSRQVPVDLGEELGEVELVGAGGAGGLEVGAGPVAGLGRERGVLAAGLGAVAVVLVVGEEPGQVAQLGPGAGGERASAVAVGAERRAVGQRGVAELVDLGRLQRLVAAGGVGVLAELVGRSSSRRTTR